jgi:hypothetical protein
MVWLKAPVRSMLESIPGVHIIAENPGEDHVTEGFTVSVDGSEHNLYIRGFATVGILPRHDDVEIEMVEVSTGFSDGDMPNDPVLVLVHANIKAGLMTMGHSPVDSLDPYF